MARQSFCEISVSAVWPGSIAFCATLLLRPTLIRLRTFPAQSLVLDPKRRVVPVSRETTGSTFRFAEE